MSNKNVEQFISFLLNNKSMSNKQRSIVTSLFVRDLTSPEGSILQVPTPSKTQNFHPEKCETEIIFRFLHLFSEKDALKYTTHTWERSPDTGKFIYEDFESFKEAYSSILNEWEQKICSIGNSDLWILIKNFLLNTDTNYFWGEGKLQVGYNKYLALWMKNNPDNQPFSMPLSEFPESIRPQTINKRSLNSFNDVVEIFKHCIEFRDNDFYYTVKRTFKNKSFNINKEKLKTLQGITFYTHTQNVKNALEIISGNISNRTEYPDIEISCTSTSGDTRNSIQLEILQVGSFSNREIESPKVLGMDPNGDIATIKKNLHNLCDFSVESIFKRDGNFIPLRINYLSSDKKTKGFEHIPKETCCGFKYILTFYTYNSLSS